MSEAGGGTPIGNPAGFIADLLAQGATATEGLDLFRGAGAGMRTQTWYRLWGEVQSAFAQKADLLGMDYGALPSDDRFVDWAAGRAGTYAYDVEVLVRDVDTGTVIRQRYTATSDTVLSPGEAVDEALDVWDQNIEEGGSGQGQVVLGGAVANMYRMTGRAR